MMGFALFYGLAVTVEGTLVSGWLSLMDLLQTTL